MGMMKITVRTLLRILGFYLIFVALFYPEKHLIEIQQVNWEKEYDRAMSRHMYRMFHKPAETSEGRERAVLEYKQKELSHWRDIPGEVDWLTLFDRYAADDNEGRLFLTKSSLPASADRLHRIRTYIHIDQGQETQWVMVDGVKAYEYQWDNLPSSLKYPFRKMLWLPLFLLVAVYWLTGTYMPRTTLYEKTSVCTGFIWGWGFTFAGLLLMVTPYLFGAEDAMPPAIFVGGFAVIVGIITFACMSRPLKVLKGMVSGDDVVAHWQYDAEQWQTFVGDEYEKNRKQMKHVFVLVFGIAVVVLAGFVLIERDAESVYAALLVGGFVLLLFPFAWYMLRAQNRRMEKPGDIYIANKGLYINGAVHSWNLIGSQLEKVDYNEECQILTFSYSYTTRFGRSTAEVNIPIPAGCPDDIESLVAAVLAGNAR